MTYQQSTGHLMTDMGALLGVCYAGQGAGKNQPGWQSVSNTGPLPQGGYQVGALVTRPHYGPSVFLTPLAETRMRGRSGFLMHLDNPAHVGDSSDGCIICPSLTVLQAAAASGEALMVVA